MPQTIKPPLPSRTLNFAKELRKHGTDAEKRLWFHLRAKRFQGIKWRRQHPLPPYIVDFYCHSLRLVVELDGGQHTVQQDSVRSAYLESMGLQVLRFWDGHVLMETDAVLEAILNSIRERTLSPSPSPGGRGEQWSKMQ
jgi:very-short-patch-repair endonuclease